MSLFGYVQTHFSALIELFSIHDSRGCIIVTDTFTYDDGFMIWVAFIRLQTATKYSARKPEDESMNEAIQYSENIFYILRDCHFCWTPQS